MRLTLLCHASTAAVRTAAFPADEPLDAHGSKALARVPLSRLRGDRCWTSPALRARQTAQALQVEATVEPALNDCGYGRWTGRSLDDVGRDEPEALGQWLVDPAANPHGGESILDLIDRVGRWLEAVRESPGHTVAITHASVIRAALVHAISAPPRSFWRIDVAPLSLARLNGNAGRWTLSSIGPLSARSG